MAAVASNHKSEGFRGPNSDQFTESGPSFTAVNGTASTAQSAQKDRSDDANGLPTPPGNLQLRAKSPAPTPSRPNQVSIQQDRVPTPSQNPSTDIGISVSPPISAPASVPASNPNSTQRHEANEDPHASYVSSHSRTPSSQQSKTATTSPQKRKRSYSEDYDKLNNNNNNNSNNNNNNPTYHNHALPSPERQRIYAPENALVHKQETASPPNAYPPPPEHARTHQPELYPRPERQRMTRDDYNQRVDPSIAPAPPEPYYSEARMAEALVRENRNYDGMGPRETFASPEEEDEQHTPQYGEYGANRSSQSGVDIDRKRRKRVFSNRTKTGCMTCRRRKKKCDEQHPECNNCLRGGFVCEGYTMRNTWQKPADTKPPVPLQSKHGSYPVLHRAPYRYTSELSPEYAGPPPTHYAASDGDRVKPILLDEEQDVNSRSSPQTLHPKPAWSKGARPYPSNPPHISKYQPEAEHRIGSAHEIAYEAPDQSPMHAPAPHTPAPPPATVHRNNSSQAQYSTPPSQPASKAANHHNVQVATQALQHFPQPQPQPQRPSSHRQRVELTEREKMLKGNYYQPFSPALVEDRERCIAAIWRFNNATNPSHGASPEERARLFKAIINTTPTPEPIPPSNGGDGASSIQPSMSIPFIPGTVGKDVVVEAPFHCDYGYNITIGDSVLIGADCRISDTCAVSIGARTILSPSVRLVCATYPIDPQRRNGSSGPALGRNIVIEEDCWIGCGVIILAGVKVGKSSTVGAGSLLHQDVPPYTVVAGNPAKVSRGIAHGSSDVA